MANKTHTNSRLLAVSVIALTVSACASSPINIEPDSTVGRLASKAGEIGTSTWARTKHVLRLDGTNTADDYLTADASLNDEFSDDVELALLDAPADDGLVIVESLNASAEGTTDATLGVQPVALTEGYIHEVTDGETLWDLSKRFTGDATNWKVMAELNGLDANGTVHPGLEILFPGDLVIASRLPQNNDALTEEAVDTQVASAERLPLPTKEDAADTTTEIVAASNAVTPVVPATAIEVQAGETLWDLAKRTTGDATNWKVIAAANGMTEQEAAFIKFGQKLDVPNDIVKDATLTVAKAPESNESAPELVVAEEDVNPVIKPIGEPKTTVVATANNTVEDVVTPTEEEVTLIPAKFEAEPPVIDNAEQELAKLDSAQPEAAESEWIMVSGTYYPKAIYNDANFSSTLMMRVSPGTKLEVTNAIGPWFEVKTDQGVGYVHTRDIK